MRLCRADQRAIDGHVGPRLFRICRQRALDQQRKERRMPTSASHTLGSCSDMGPGPAELREREEAGQDILRLLSTLPAKQQEVVRLKFQAGLSYREISEVTELSVSNVGFLLHTALRDVARKPHRCRERTQRRNKQLAWHVAIKPRVAMQLRTRTKRAERDKP